MKKYPIYNETKGHSLRGLRIAIVMAEDKASAIRAFKGALYLEDPDVTFIYEINSLPVDGVYRVGDPLYDRPDYLNPKYWDNVLTATTLTNLGNLKTVGGELKLEEMATAKQGYNGIQGPSGIQGPLGKLLPAKCVICGENSNPEDLISLCPAHRQYVDEVKNEVMVKLGPDYKRSLEILKRLGVN